MTPASVTCRERVQEEIVASGRSEHGVSKQELLDALEFE